MSDQLEWTAGDAGEDPPAQPKRTARGRRARGASGPAPVDTAASSEEASAPGAEQDPTAFPDVEHLAKKGLRVVPVVTGAVVDPAGTFLFYVDGHDDVRSAVQAQLNHLLDCGPSREEHLARARARVRYLEEKLTRPR